MIRRLGFCCQWFHHDQTLKKKQLEEYQRPFNTRSTTVRWLNEHKDEAEDKLQFVFHHNLESIKKLIKCKVILTILNKNFDVLFIVLGNVRFDIIHL